ncbi:MAG: hypothetical protein LBT37_06350 [Lactobacillaceae bacterium]|jgi:hypothetical protein|nr:hypothetical protein [Lactobacillaceae bacterium]
MKNLVIKAKDNEGTKYNPIWIDANTHAKLRELRNSTGVSMRDLAKDMIEYAMDNLTVEESRDGINPD